MISHRIREVAAANRTPKEQRNLALSACEGGEAGEPVTDLIAQATTNTVKPAHHLCTFLPCTCPYFCYLRFPPRYTETKKVIRLFFVVGYNPSGKYIIFPSPTRLHVSHSLISATSLFSHQVTGEGECCCYLNCWASYS